MAEVERQNEAEFEVHVLSDSESGATARVATGYGFNCFSFRCPRRGGDWELIAADPRFCSERLEPSAHGIPVLFPFPNRISAGRFEFAGRSWELERNEPGGRNAIHGLVIDRPWRAVDTDGSLSGEFQASRDAPELLQRWPGDFRIKMTYELAGTKLHCRIEVENPSEQPLPYGFGLHPYFRLPLRADGPEQSCTVRVPIRQLWELDEQFLPTGRCLPVPAHLNVQSAKPLADLQLDHVFTGLEFDPDGWCRCELSDAEAGERVIVSFDRFFEHVVLYIPPQRGSICIEPYTCVTDAVNLSARGVEGTGWRVLAPGERAEGQMAIELAEQ